MDAEFACGSMVLFIFIYKKFYKVKFFVNKEGFFRPAGGQILFRVRDRVTHIICELTRNP